MAHNIIQKYERGTGNLKGHIEARKLYRAKVVDNKDPNKAGRVKVWIPDLMKDTVDESDGKWALPANNLFVGNGDTDEEGLNDCGSCIIPPKGTYVTVFFEDEEFNNPRYLAGLNLDTKACIPAENQAGKEYFNKWTLLKTPKGRQIFLSDDPDDACVIIRGKYKKRESGSGPVAEKSDPRDPEDSMYVELYETDEEQYLIMKDAIGQYFLIDQKNKTIRIQHVSGSYIEFTSDGDIKIESAKHIRMNQVGASLKKHK